MSVEISDEEVAPPPIEPSPKTPDPLSRVFRRAPVTSMLVAPYLLLFVPVALINSNPDVDFILKVLAFAVLPPAAFEFGVKASSPTQRLSKPSARYGRELWSLAKAVTLVGLASTLLSALMGSGTIMDQASGVGTASSPLVALTNLFLPWQYLGLALVLAAHANGIVGNRAVLNWFGIGLAVNVAKFAVSAISAPMFTFMITSIFLLIYCRILRTRHAVIGMVVVLALWPALHTARDHARAGIGAAATSGSASERLRYDVQIVRAADITPPLDVGQPGVKEILRYGLVPRVLDQKRSVISTGVLIASYLAGQPTPWAYTFLPVTTLYVFEGGVRLGLFYLGMAALLMMLLGNGTRRTPLALMVLALILSGPLGWFATFPDSTIGTIQGLVASIPILFALWTMRARRAQNHERSNSDQVGAIA